MRPSRIGTLLAGTLLIAAGAAVTAASPASAAPAQDHTIQIAAATAQPATNPGEIFRSVNVLTYKGAGGTIGLSGSATADQAIQVDDELDIQVCSPTSQTCSVVYSHDFSNNCTTGITPVGPIGLNAYIPPGPVAIIIQLKDKCGELEGNSDIFLTGTAVIPRSVTTGGADCNTRVKTAAGSLTDPVTKQVPTQPFVGADHKIHGTGIVNIINNNNCSAQVQFRLETKVCNRLGLNCNPKTIAKTKFFNLAASGQMSQDLTGNCRTGTDSYRVVVQVIWGTFDGFDGDENVGVPIFVSHSQQENDGDLGYVKLTC